MNKQARKGSVEMPGVANSMSPVGGTSGLLNQNSNAMDIVQGAGGEYSSDF